MTLKTLILVLFLLVPPTQSAGPPPSLLTTCLRMAKQAALPILTANYSGKVIDVDGHRLVLGRRLALGDRGAVYPLAASSRLPGVDAGQIPLVAKIPHALLIIRPPRPHPEAQLELAREAEAYRWLVEAWPKVRKSERYPRDTAWEDGRLPVAPLLAQVSSEQYGTILVKPLLGGKSLGRILAENGGRLNEEMTASLKEIYATTKAVSEHVRLPVPNATGGWTGGRPFYTDVNPTNLVWVSDANEMRALKLKRPSFVFYEMTPLVNREPQYLTLGN